MGIAEDLADKIAADVIAYIQRTGDEDIVAQVGKTLGDQSQTLQEAFVTSFRVQRAAIRAERLLAEKIAQHEGRAPPELPKVEAPAAPPEPEPAVTTEPEPVAVEPEDEMEAEPSDPFADAIEAEDGAPDDEEPEAQPATPSRPILPKRKRPVPTVGSGRPKFG